MSRARSLQVGYDFFSFFFIIKNKCNQLSLTRKKIIKIRPQLSELSCGQKEEHTKAEEIG